ncbi:MAG: hypothetical protein IPM51_02825 [Sphingobacteriaceae bacterium]|nr:hypothetical protein [Sphingobacteriaceae bacterium]
MIKQHFIYWIVILSCFNNPIFSQKDTSETMGGVYLTTDDFKKGKLMYDIDCSTEKQKIKLFNFFTKPYFDVYYQGEKFRLQKNQVYGFKDCHDRTFRFYENMEFQLVEAGKIYLYFQEQLMFTEKAGSSSDAFFFSTEPGSVIKPLNVSNLKKAYPTNKTFHKLMDTQINNRNINAYDSLNKMYKINSLFIESLSKQ